MRIEKKCFTRGFICSFHLNIEYSTLTEILLDNFRPVHSQHINGKLHVQSLRDLDRSLLSF